MEILHFVLGIWTATLSTVKDGKEGSNAIDNDENTMAKTLVSRKDKMVNKYKIMIDFRTVTAMRIPICF